MSRKERYVRYQEVERKLLEEIDQAWSAWRRSPEGQTPPSFEFEWTVIRLLRFASRHGTNNLTQRQVRLLVEAAERAGERALAVSLR